MRLSKVNLVKKGVPATFLTPKNLSNTPQRTEKTIIGAFWYVKGELTDEEARERARAKQVDGFRGNIFFGSAEKEWHMTLAKREIRRDGLPKNRFSKSSRINKPKHNGRSYGLLSDEEEEDMNQFGHVGRSDDDGIGSSESALVLHDSIISPPTSPPITQYDRISEDDGQHMSDPDSSDLTPPMPGSFILEDKSPLSPTFSVSLTESFSNFGTMLRSTPDRPHYVNPGIALEPRFDISSPLPRSARFDLTPRQLAALSRKKQGFERIMERDRSGTPSLMSDNGIDDVFVSEKEKAERERRRKDLLRFRLERERRQRLEYVEEEEQTRVSESGSNKRPWMSGDVMEVEEEPPTKLSKQSRSSAIFTSALHGGEPDVRVVGKNSIFDRSSTRGIGGIDDKTSGPDSSQDPKNNHQSYGTTNLNAHLFEQSAVPTPSKSKNSYAAPTPSPSPSPPLQPQQAVDSQQNHAPKIPSNLRNATNVLSSPVKSSVFEVRSSNNHRTMSSPSELSMASVRTAVTSIPSSELAEICFPFLRTSSVAHLGRASIDQLTSLFPTQYVL